MTPSWPSVSQSRCIFRPDSGLTWPHLPEPESQASPVIRARSPVTDRSRSHRSHCPSAPRLSCVPVILAADCWTIMGFAAVLRIYKFWLNYWFTIYPNNFTKFVCMHQFWARPLTKTSGNWGLFSPRFVIECVFLTLLIIIQSNVVISMNVFDCNDSYHGFTFLVLHTIHFYHTWIDKQAQGIRRKKQKNLSQSVSRFMKIEKICDNWIGCGKRKPWWVLI